MPLLETDNHYPAIDVDCCDFSVGSPCGVVFKLQGGSIEDHDVSLASTEIAGDKLSIIFERIHNSNN